jgi:hypothetical protein
MPTRWAFEGMLLLETDQRRQDFPAQPGAEPARQDMAERYFPRKDHRLSPGWSSLALAGMLVVLIGGIHVILRMRDIH